MKPRLVLLLANLALFAAWTAGCWGKSWPDGHF
jgi:hypothetical protein